MADKGHDSKVKSEGNPYDLDGQQFNPDIYMQKLLKEYNLQQIMDHETDVVKDTLTLHSDMQTLVYENYNKFISATDTVRKMKTDFKKMEDEMDLLAKNMDSITSFSELISSTLQDSRQQIARLSGIHSLLKRLQFLFKLPTKLKALMEEENYAEAVQDYLHTQRVLEQYGNLESFQGIQRECNDILDQLKERLRSQFKSKDATAKELAESVDLLLQLDEPAESLCSEFLAHAKTRLQDQLTLLKDTPCQDLIEFIDLGSNGFLSDLCFVVTSYNDMFINRPACCDTEAGGKLSQFVFDNMHQYLDLVQSHIESQQDGGDSAILVRALDRFYRRLTAVNSLFDDDDFVNAGMELVMRAARRQCRMHLHALKSQLTDSLSHVRQALAAPRLVVTDAVTQNGTELVTQLVLATVEKVKGVLQDLLVFIQPDLAFAAKPKFLEAFCIDSVREGLVVGFIHHLTATARSFCSANVPSLPLLLILSKTCLEFEATNIHYLLSLTDEWFSTDGGSALLTSGKEMCAGTRQAAQELLNHYVHMQGLAISQMLRKSVETRDWLHSLEPRTVRAVMKRIMEEMATIDSQVGMLFEEGSHTERSSDSSHKTHSRLHRSTASNWSSHSLAASHIHKLFSERIEIFAPVQFNKVSILTGVIKISLKTLLECIRLKTFSKYGLQQIQVDSHYLQLYLWRYVADENLIQFLLDEILSSAVHRCLDPVLMEPSVVDIICERG
ncbi:vacuolar protein sorting-associated protein 51 homolog [Macrosteles quadrilineatus]|uniref:vacuolar protein sorting-associated protein 51 homolog n=1 Tax=Macrosteles quadrilineatus TaxID=74068 RepID=UPI0023E208B7|nr:vacuolar protein sorting-associated protein 51 homolog [Macrosteles quadrilineatus]